MSRTAVAISVAVALLLCVVRLTGLMMDDPRSPIMRSVSDRNEPASLAPDRKVAINSVSAKSGLEVSDVHAHDSKLHFSRHLQLNVSMPTYCTYIGMYVEYVLLNSKDTWYSCPPLSLVVLFRVIQHLVEAVADSRACGVVCTLLSNQIAHTPVIPNCGAVIGGRPPLSTEVYPPFRRSTKLFWQTVRGNLDIGWCVFCLLSQRRITFFFSFLITGFQTFLRHTS